MNGPLKISLYADDLIIGEYISYATPQKDDVIQFRVSSGSNTILGGPMPYPVILPFSVMGVMHAALNILSLEHWHIPHAAISSDVQLNVAPLNQAAINYINRIKLLSEAH